MMTDCPTLSMTLRATLLLLAVLGSASLVVRAQDSAPDSFERAVPGLRDRLLQLDPSSPKQYLELGEEVLAEMPSAQGRDLARRLLILAFELDPVTSGPSATKASACLALASISFDDAERRWLELIASTRSDAPLTLAPGGAADRARVQEHSLAHEVAELIARLRGENAANWRSFAQREEVRSIIAGLTGPMKSAGELFDRVRSRPVCPECGSRRTVRARNNDDDAPFELCPTCGGNPGARLNAAEFMLTLRVEAALVQAGAETWSGRLHLDNGAPMRDSQGASIASFYGIDPAKPFWSPEAVSADEIGSWVERSSGARARIEPAADSQLGA